MPRPWAAAPWCAWNTPDRFAPARQWLQSCWKASPPAGLLGHLIRGSASGDAMTVENQTTKMPLSTLRPEAFRPALLAGEPAHQATWDHAVVCLNFVGEAFKSNRNWLQRGWPDKLTPGMLAQLQWPNNPEMENALIFGLLRGCMDGSIPNHKPERLEKIKNELYVRGAIFQNELTPVSERDRPHVYRIGWEAFQGWLAQRNTAPSEHISAWFAAQGMTDSEPLGNSTSSATETKEQRQDRRLQACVDAGLPM